MKRKGTWTRRIRFKSKKLEQNKTDEECGEELKNRREELELDIEQTQYQINNCDGDQKEDLEIQMMEYKKLKQ